MQRAIITIHHSLLDCFPDGIAEKAENEILELKA
jgi:hypothetical protein